MTTRRILTALLVVLGIGLIGGNAESATIAASYHSGYRDVLINDYRTQGLGTFRLADGGSDRLALCLEADEPHSERQDAYVPVPNRIVSPELDVLLWLLERSGPIDDDTAIAAASVAWYLADAQRTIGVPVWSNGATGFAPISPIAPESWDSLEPFSLRHPVGLRSGGRDLDAAERRVVELYREAVSLRGPWTLGADAHDTDFRLTGPGGPIPGQTVTIALDTPDGETIEIHATTNDAGWADARLPDLPDGATVRASAEAPGLHREWDGDDRIQRMSTATTAVLTAAFDIAPMPRHVEVLKLSSDPTISVAGGQFVLDDADGAEVGRATSDVDGRARFEPIDAATHPGPYVVRESVAPPGLSAAAKEIAVHAASRDPASPTVVEVVNHPATVPVRVHKRLTTEAVGPPDRSGFAFSAMRRADGRSVELVTGADGITDVALLPLGMYTVCELAAPAWATNLVDGGCLTTEITVETLVAGDIVELDYLNLVPPPSIDTRVLDPEDGDRSIAHTGGRVVDEVTLNDLVPGTSYTVAGEVVALDALGNPTSTDATGATGFIAQSSEAQITVEFDLPALAPGTLVIVERLLVDGRIVAEHADLTDADQTLQVLSRPTTTTTSTTTTSTTTTTTVAPATTPPPPAATTTSTTTTTTSGAAITIAPTHTSPPIASVPPATTPRTLPRTGPDTSTQLLRLGDAGFVLGVGLTALAGLMPRRRRV